MPLETSNRTRAPRRVSREDSPWPLPAEVFWLLVLLVLALAIGSKPAFG